MKVRRIWFLVSVVAMLALAWNPWPTFARLTSESMSSLANGGFEEGAYASGATPDGWAPDAFDPPNASLAWVDGVARTGSRSVLVRATAPNDARWTQTVTVQPNSAYQLSGWIKTEGVEHTGQSVDAGANLSLMDTWTRSEALFGTHDWTFVSLEFTTGAETQVLVAARIGFYSGTTTGAAWFDDLALERLEPPALVPINLLANPSVDDGVYPGTSLPSSWRTDAFQPSTARFAWDNGVAHNGGKSVKISATSPNDARWVQTVKVKLNTTYRLSGWIKTENVANTTESENAGANLTVMGWMERTEAVLGTQDWAFVSVEFYSGGVTEMTVAARLGFYAGTTTGTAWFDDLRLEAEGFSPLKNGGFESGTFVANGTPPGWAAKAYHTKTATFAWDEANSYVDRNSLHIALETPNQAAWQQTVSVEPHHRYQLSGWVKTVDVQSRAAWDDNHALGETARADKRHAGAYLAVKEPKAFSKTLAGTEDWTYLSVVFETGSRKTVTIQAAFGERRALVTGRAWFDELRLAPLDPVPHPRWQVLALIYTTTDFAYTDDEGVAHRVVATMTQAEQERAAAALRRFANVDVPALSDENMFPSLTIREPERPLSALDPYLNGTWWPSPGNTASERSGVFDSVIVVWASRGIDQATGQVVELAGAGGLTPGMGTGQTYSAIIIGSVADNQRNVFKHEWGHSITSYFDAAGTAPKPAVDNHIGGDTMYVHCRSGKPYVLQDETDDQPIRNSIYNNDTGFTHDYYSGMTATPDQPKRCLGITPESWATGGPVSKVP